MYAQWITKEDVIKLAAGKKKFTVFPDKGARSFTQGEKFHAYATVLSARFFTPVEAEPLSKKDRRKAEIGRRLKATRESVEMSKRTVSKMLAGTTENPERYRRYLQTWENGEFEPRGEILVRLAKIYRVPVESFYPDDDEWEEDAA